jgi:hypothetical protein
VIVKATKQQAKKTPHRHHWVPMRGPVFHDRPRVYDQDAKAWTYGRGPNRHASARGGIIGRRCITCKRAEETR